MQHTTCIYVQTLHHMNENMDLHHYVKNVVVKLHVRVLHYMYMYIHVCRKIPYVIGYRGNCLLNVK